MENNDKAKGKRKSPYPELGSNHRVLLCDDCKKNFDLAVENTTFIPCLKCEDKLIAEGKKSPRT